jgi:PKD repeat protein
MTLRPAGVRGIVTSTALGVMLGTASGGWAATPPDGWRIRLEAALPGVLDKGRVTLGSSAGAATGLDAYDEPHPAAWSRHHADLYTEHQRTQPGWETQALPVLRYRAEYQPALDGVSARAMEIVLESGQPGGATLTWSTAPTLELARYYLVLRDAATGATADMWAQSSLTVGVAAGRRVLRVELTPGREAPPVAHDQSVTTPEDTSLAIVLTAEDPEGDPLTYVIVTPPAHGTLLGVAPAVTYVPGADFNGLDAFTFQASDGGATPSNAATVEITVTPVNDAPVAQAQSVATDEDTPVAITLAGSDADGDALTFEISAQPVHGALSGTPPDVTYAPATDYNGADSFAFRVSDGPLVSPPAVVTLLVAPVPDPPLADFSVPGPSHNVATWTSDVASFNAGGDVVAASSALASAPALNAIDDNPLTTWSTASGQRADQWLVVRLAGDAPRRVDALRLVNGGASGSGVRNFRLQVSSSAPDDASFVTVIEGQAQDTRQVQEFALPAGTTARYARLLALDNHGSACCLTLGSFEVVDYGRSGPVSFSSSGDVSARPELAFDGNGATAWRSAAGRVAGEFVVARLAEDDAPLIDRVRLQAPVGGEGLRGFDVLVSTTGTAPGDFEPVLSATLAADGQAHEYVLPGGVRRARFVKLEVRSNQGATTGVRLAEFEAVTAGTEGNVVSAGATVLGVSSQSSSASGPRRALDFDPSGPGWETASGQVVNQWVELALPGADTWRIDRLMLQGAATTASPRRFELLAAPADGAPFTRAASGALRRGGALQHFTFPAVDARRLRLVLLDNHGGANASVQLLRVVSSQLGAAESRFVDRSTEVDAPITGHAWTFGDGGAAAEADPAHAYASAADHDVTLTVTDAAGSSATRTRRYRVVAPPAPSFTAAPTLPGESQTVVLTDTSSDASGIVFREWSFGDGTANVASSQPTASHSFADDGAYNVTLTVTNLWGLKRTAARMLTVANLPPTVNAGADRRAIAGDDWGGSASAADPGFFDRALLTCEWDYGDGSTRAAGACGAAPHVYTRAGTYTATVTVRDKDGASASDDVVVTVFPRECAVAGGTYVEPEFCGPYTVASLGEVPSLPQQYSGLAFGPGDANTLLIGAGAIGASGAIYTVPLTRDAAGHVVGFGGPAQKWLDVPNLDGGLAFGPGGVLFSARWPDDILVQVRPGSAQIDKQIALRPLGLNAVALNFVPPGYPSACELRLVNFFGGRWWAPTLAPDGAGTYDITAVRETQPIVGGPEQLAYVPEGSPLVADRRTVLVTENVSSNLAAYEVDGRADPIPSTRRLLSTGVPSAEALTFDPVTGDLLVTSLNTKRVTVVRGFRAPAFGVDVTPSDSAWRPGDAATLSVRVSAASGEPRAGLPVRFSVVSGPHAGASGTCAPNADCTTSAEGLVSFSYTGSADGDDEVRASFTSHFCQDVASAPARVHWSTNRPPTAQDQSVATLEDTPLAITLVAGDPDGDALTYAVVAQPAHGTLSGTPPHVIYAPEPNASGPDSFTFVANDGSLASNIASVSIVVTAVNDAPVAQDQAVDALEDAPLAITLVAGDPDGDALTYAVVTQPAHGVLTGSLPNPTYTPASNYAGPDGFTFVAHDGSLVSNVATVALTVVPANDPPVAYDQSVTTDFETAVAVTLTASDPDGDTLSYVVVTPPAHGTLSGGGAQFTYVPAAGYEGSDSFTFKVSDGWVDSHVATVVLRVNGPTNMPPDCGQAGPSVAVLWPPNHTWRAIGVQGVSDPEGHPVTVTVTGVRQDEPVNGLGDGDTSPDAMLAPLQVRSERSGTLNGRVYHVQFTASDGRVLAAVVLEARPQS